MYWVRVLDSAERNLPIYPIKRSEIPPIIDSPISILNHYHAADLQDTMYREGPTRQMGHERLCVESGRYVRLAVCFSPH